MVSCHAGGSGSGCMRLGAARAEFGPEPRAADALSADDGPGPVGLAGLVRLVGVLPTAGVAPVALRLSALLPAALLPTALAVGLLRRVLARVVRAVLARILAGIVRFVLLSHGSTSRMPG